MREQEEWRQIPDWPDYMVSSDGRVASVKRGVTRVLLGGKTSTGYRNVLLYKKGRRQTFRVHALVAAAFHGPRPAGLEVRHLDGDQLNNAAANLAYGTREENIEDKRRHDGLLLIIGEDPVPTAYQERIPPAYRGHRVTRCVNDHPYDEANSYFFPSGRRICRTCQSASARRYRERQMLRAAGIEVAA